MSPGRLDILTEALTFVARLIMQARTDRDAEALRHQLEALGDTKRADVGSIEAERLRELRQDEPTQSSPLEKRRIAPDFHRDPDACQECHRMPCVCDVRPLIGGPLGEGD